MFVYLIIEYLLIKCYILGIMLGSGRIKMSKILLFLDYFEFRGVSFRRKVRKRGRKRFYFLNGMIESKRRLVLIERKKNFNVFESFR